MATFYNQATLSFAGRVTNSNITEGELVSGITLTKAAITTDYGPGDRIAYAVTITNADNVAKSGLTLTDDLGAYTIPGDTSVLVPLTYNNGSLIYYQNGVIQATPTVTAGPPLTVSGIDIPAGGNVILLYEATANAFAPLDSGATITNTASVSGTTGCEPISVSTQVETRDEPNLSIAKAVCPQALTCGDEVTYTFIIQNSGNTAVVATDDLIVSDTFNPILTGITVLLNGQPLEATTGYVYDEATGAFTTVAGAITVPAATYARDPVTDAVTTTPGVAVLTVTGII